MLISLFLVVSCGSGDSGDGGGNGNGGDSGLTSCTSDELFTVSPLASADFVGLVALGNLNPTGHTFPTDHIYFYIRSETTGSSAQIIKADPSITASVPIYAPGNATITSVARSENLTAGTSDYSVYFSPCTEFRAYFLHVSSLSVQIEGGIGDFDTDSCSTYTTGGSTYRMCQKEVDIAITAGETIGTAGGIVGQNALDMGAYDARIEALDFANPERFWQASDHFDRLHVVCPVDYFIEDVRDELTARFGNYDGTEMRTIEPLCGTIMQDVKDTAQGMWFIEGTEGTYTQEDPQLALVHDNVDPTIGVFSVGNSISNLSYGVYQFTPSTTGLVNTDFNLVTADGEVHCYEASSEVIIIKLTDATSLTIEKKDDAACGAGPWAFTSNAVNFIR